MANCYTVFDANTHVPDQPTRKKAADFVLEYPCRFLAYRVMFGASWAGPSIGGSPIAIRNLLYQGDSS